MKTILVFLSLLALSQAIRDKRAFSIQHVMAQLLQNIDGYTLQLNKDVYFYDIKQVPGANVTTLRDLCNSRIDCVGFTTYGFLKYNIPPPDQWHPTPNEAGLYIKNASPSLDDYQFIPGKDSSVSDIAPAQITDLATLKSKCDANITCRGFTTYGLLKYDSSDISQWQSAASSPSVGMYLKKADPRRIDGYSLKYYRDVYSYNIKQVPDANVTTLRDLCNNRIDCVAFTTNGFLKNNIPPEDPWYITSNGQGLFVKNAPRFVDGYNFMFGKDISNQDNPADQITDLATIKSKCDTNATCLGFNTFGFLKYKILPQFQVQDSTRSPSVGIYVKKTGPQPIDGYSLTLNKDVYGYDIQQIPDANVTTLLNLCNSKTECVGFTTYGFLKYNIPPPDKWRSTPNEAGLYIKNR